MTWSPGLEKSQWIGIKVYNQSGFIQIDFQKSLILCKFTFHDTECNLKMFFTEISIFGVSAQMLKKKT